MPKLRESSSETLQQFYMRALNTEIDIAIWCMEKEAESMKHLARTWFEQVEKRFSRFRPDSELCHLNTLAGERSMVSKPMLKVLLLAEFFRLVTEGIFNPFILKALENAGYNDNFDKLKLKKSVQYAEYGLNGSLYMTLDSATESVQLSPHTAIDLGGIVKSWAVRCLTEDFQNKLNIRRGLINAGGDLNVWGNSSEAGEPWLIGIENPWLPSEDIGILALGDGAVATSSTLGRQWSTNQGLMHHLIDPRTMRPSESDVVQCTVCGQDVIECEIWAKVICILGLKEGLSLFGRKTNGLEALVFTKEKQIHFYGQKESLGKTWRNAKIDYYHYAEKDKVF